LIDKIFGAPGSWSFQRCQNPQCGLFWLDPIPFAEDIFQAYAHYYTHTPQKAAKGVFEKFLERVKTAYLANNFGYTGATTNLERLLGILPWLYPGRNSELDFSVMWLHAHARGRLLDVGAGSGWHVAQMNRLGWQAEGLDFDAHLVQAARARNLVFHQGGLLEQNFGGESFDALTMSHFIEHVHDPLSLLVEVRRILKPGAHFSLVTPNTDSLGRFFFKADWRGLEPPRHLHLFNRTSMATLMKRAGFETFQIFTSIRDANGMFIASKSLRQNAFFDMNAPRGYFSKGLGRSVQMAEALVKLGWPDVGEELVVLARAPGANRS
jgi:2-polyprenyl-3-methyl-5-hydroxy-6-metoxy-1,4-benzoquinol methylase